MYSIILPFYLFVISDLLKGWFKIFQVLNGQVIEIIRIFSYFTFSTTETPL